jgi:hypothetical protein
LADYHAAPPRNPARPTHVDGRRLARPDNCSVGSKCRIAKPKNRTVRKREENEKTSALLLRLAKYRRNKKEKNDVKRKSIEIVALLFSLFCLVIHFAVMTQRERTNERHMART